MKFLLILILALLSNLIVINARTNNEECTFCGFIINYIEGQVETNKTENEILGELEKVCSFVPNSLQSTCDSLVMVDGEDLIKMVFAKENSTVICEQIDMCPKSSNKYQNLKKPISDEVYCTICNFISGETEELLQKYDNDTQIMEMLDNDCARYGRSSTICQTLVSQYFPVIVYLLKEGQPPQAICNEIRLCGQ
ncbi:hypothetical protein DICPUDRAFT_76726 [Dictyostelium purpureum]|uniref:Saposin B-type domain-containing protein n=1 Tax=Dictyostelium purpureum TaxID=5786 RepID=F0ZEG1_DICPU|nr:uncharacterized protein DICPUDRAFT_76726 [Dictyostelium purpureum]EGC37688.1 hypothetical protein DICPUDRAFT_76726 [Dictyostelium purpureum]|eukprot:XP_003285792.1 hypothetical protein DICPUDRAFT_76726 [Dictyostelium purpureum]